MQKRRNKKFSNYSVAPLVCVCVCVCVLYQRILIVKVILTIKAVWDPSVTDNYRDGFFAFNFEFEEKNFWARIFSFLLNL